MIDEVSARREHLYSTMTDCTDPKYMTRMDDLRLRAFNNATRELNLNGRLPQNVFTERWDHYRFFDPDYLFERDTVEGVAGLLGIEAA